MPTPRKPAVVMEASGAWKHDPNRRREDAATSGPISIDPPQNMTDLEKDLYRELIAIAPPKVLANCDAVIVEVTARLWAKMREQTINAAETGLLIKSLGLLGMSPADRSKVTATKETEVNEWDTLDS